MSDTFPDLTKPEPGTDTPAADFDLDAWIDGSKPTERSVPIYGRKDLMGEVDELLRRYEVAKQIPEGDRGINDDTPASLEARLEQLHAEMESSRTTWYVRALNSEQIEASRKAAEEAAIDGAEPEYTVHMIAAAASRIVRPDGATRQGITVEQLQRLRSHLGEAQMMSLIGAITRAMSEEPAIQAPFSRTSSEGPAGQAS